MTMMQTAKHSSATMVRLLLVLVVFLCTLSWSHAQSAAPGLRPMLPSLSVPLEQRLLAKATTKPTKKKSDFDDDDAEVNEDVYNHVGVNAADGDDDGGLRKRVTNDPPEDEASNVTLIDGVNRTVSPQYAYPPQVNSSKLFLTPEELYADDDRFVSKNSTFPLPLEKDQDPAFPVVVMGIFILAAVTMFVLTSIRVYRRRQGYQSVPAINLIV